MCSRCARSSSRWLVGVGITLVAGLFPAIRATRVPPIAAVREGATLPKSRFAPFVPWIAGLVAVGALAVLGRAMFVDDLGTADRLLSIAAGVLLLFLGVAMLSSHLVRPLAALGEPDRTLGRLRLHRSRVAVLAPPVLALRYGAWGPASALRRVGAFVGGVLLNPVLAADRAPHVAPPRFDGAGCPSGPRSSRASSRIASPRGRASGNAGRNPGRTAATAAALMIGIALVAFIATLTNGMKASNREAIEEQIAADYVVTSSTGTRRSRRRPATPSRSHRRPRS